MLTRETGHGHTVGTLNRGDDTMSRGVGSDGRNDGE